MVNFIKNKKNIIDILNLCFETKHDFKGAERSDAITTDYALSLRFDDNNKTKFKEITNILNLVYTLERKLIEKDDPNTKSLAFVNQKFITDVSSLLGIDINSLDKNIGDLEATIFIKSYMNDKLYPPGINMSDLFSIYAIKKSEKDHPKYFIKCDIINNKVVNPKITYNNHDEDEVVKVLLSKFNTGKDKKIFNKNEFLKELVDIGLLSNIEENKFIKDTKVTGFLDIERILFEKDNLNKWKKEISENYPDLASEYMNLTANTYQPYTKDWDPATNYGNIEIDDMNLNNQNNEILDIYNNVESPVDHVPINQINKSLKYISRFLIKIIPYDGSESNLIPKRDDQLDVLIRNSNWDKKTIFSYDLYKELKNDVNITNVSKYKYLPLLIPSSDPRNKNYNFLIKKGFSVAELSFGINYILKSNISDLSELSQSITNDLGDNDEDISRKIPPKFKLIMILVSNLLKTIRPSIESHIGGEVKDLPDDSQLIEVIIIVLFDLKKAGDWGLVQYCKENNYKLMSFDRLCSLYMILSKVTGLFSGSLTDPSIGEHDTTYTYLGIYNSKKEVKLISNNQLFIRFNNVIISINDRMKEIIYGYIEDTRNITDSKNNKKLSIKDSQGLRNDVCFMKEKIKEIEEKNFNQHFFKNSNVDTILNKNLTFTDSDNILTLQRNFKELSDNFKYYIKEKKNIIQPDEVKTIYSKFIDACDIMLGEDLLETIFTIDDPEESSLIKSPQSKENIEEIKRLNTQRLKIVSYIDLLKSLITIEELFFNYNYLSAIKYFNNRVVSVLIDTTPSKLEAILKFTQKHTHTGLIGELYDLFGNTASVRSSPSRNKSPFYVKLNRIFDNKILMDYFLDSSNLLSVNEILESDNKIFKDLKSHLLDMVSSITTNIQGNKKLSTISQLLEKFFEVTIVGKSIKNLPILISLLDNSIKTHVEKLLNPEQFNLVTELLSSIKSFKVNIYDEDGDELRKTNAKLVILTYTIDLFVDSLRTMAESEGRDIKQANLISQLSQLDEPYQNLNNSIINFLGFTGNVDESSWLSNIEYCKQNFNINFDDNDEFFEKYKTKYYELWNYVYTNLKNQFEQISGNTDSVSQFLNEINGILRLNEQNFRTIYKQMLSVSDASISLELPKSRSKKGLTKIPVNYIIKYSEAIANLFILFINNKTYSKKKEKPIYTYYRPVISDDYDIKTLLNFKDSILSLRSVLNSITIIQSCETDQCQIYDLVQESTLKIPTNEIEKDKTVDQCLVEIDTLAGSSISSNLSSRNVDISSQQDPDQSSKPVKLNPDVKKSLKVEDLEKINQMINQGDSSNPFHMTLRSGNKKKDHDGGSDITPKENINQLVETTRTVDDAALKYCEGKTDIDISKINSYEDLETKMMNKILEVKKKTEDDENYKSDGKIIMDCMRQQFDYIREEVDKLDMSTSNVLSYNVGEFVKFKQGDDVEREGFIKNITKDKMGDTTYSILEIIDKHNLNPNLVHNVTDVSIIYDKSYLDPFDSPNNFYLGPFDTSDESIVYRITPFEKETILSLICTRNLWNQCNVIDNLNSDKIGEVYMYNIKDLSNEIDKKFESFMKIETRKKNVSKYIDSPSNDLSVSLKIPPFKGKKDLITPTLYVIYKVCYTVIKNNPKIYNTDIESILNKHINGVGKLTRNIQRAHLFTKYIKELMLIIMNKYPFNIYHCNTNTINKELYDNIDTCNKKWSTEEFIDSENPHIYDIFNNDDKEFLRKYVTMINDTSSPSILKRDLQQSLKLDSNRFLQSEIFSDDDKNLNLQFFINLKDKLDFIIHEYGDVSLGKKQIKDMVQHPVKGISKINPTDKCPIDKPYKNEDMYTILYCYLELIKNILVNI